ncbi:MAG TPA: hypothetical protein VH478_04485 [Trebonia sp.]|nr:hypothetical protein [Trebonia sp.]
MSALIVGGGLAIPAVARAAANIGPRQYFVGEIFNTSSAAADATILVVCPSGALTGHPAGGQSVAVHEVVPPPATLGYTGNYGVKVDVSLIFTVGGVTTVDSIATLSQYDVRAPISTGITVPCSGSGVMSYTPLPNPDNSGKSSAIGVAFKGVAP